MLRPVWCNNGGTKSSACRSCIVVYSRVMIFWFSNTVYFLHDRSEFIFYWGWQLCDAIVWAWLDCEARVSTCMPEVLKTDFAWQFHLFRLVQERCNSCGKPFLPSKFASLSMLSKKMQTGKKKDQWWSNADHTGRKPMDPPLQIGLKKMQHDNSKPPKFIEER